MKKINTAASVCTILALFFAVYQYFNIKPSLAQDANYHTNCSEIKNESGNIVLNCNNIISYEKETSSYLSKDGGIVTTPDAVIDTLSGSPKSSTPKFGFKIDIDKNGGCVASVGENNSPEIRCNTR